MGEARDSHIAAETLQQLTTAKPACVPAQPWPEGAGTGRPSTYWTA
jgi:hypothetical protein